MIEPRPSAITFDFYGTLVHPKHEEGRGGAFMEMLRTHGYESAPWEHQVLYDVFERHGIEYDPHAALDDRRRYYERLSRRVFERLGVEAPDGAPDRHAEEVWRIFGAHSFELFPDVVDVLGTLSAAGFPMAIVSNWQKGLRHFLVELGLDEYFDHVLSSDELGSFKPDDRIFLEACGRLGCAPSQVLHIGDTYTDDWQGGRDAGLSVILIRRDGEVEPDVDAIRSLRELPSRLGLEGSRDDRPEGAVD